MERVTKYIFEDAAERNTYGPAGTGVLDGDLCSLRGDFSEWLWDIGAAAWRPSGGTVGQNPIVAPAGSPTVNIDFNTSPNVRVDASAITGAGTFTLSNPITGGHYTVLVINGPGIGLTWNWPANVKFPLGVVPIPDPSGLFRMYYDGTNYYVFSTAINLL